VALVGEGGVQLETIYEAFPEEQLPQLEVLFQNSLLAVLDN
jgi:hypothetical protein